MFFFLELLFQFFKKWKMWKLATNLNIFFKIYFLRKKSLLQNLKALFQRNIKGSSDCKQCFLFNISFFQKTSIIKIWQNAKLLIQILRRRNSFFFEIWRFYKFIFQNLARCKMLKFSPEIYPFNLFLRFWLNYNTYCQRWYQLVVKRRSEKQCLVQIQPPFERLKAAARPVASQSGRKSVMTTDNFHTGHRQKSEEHKIFQIKSVFHNTPQWC